jgi:hypothetical protein
MHLSHQFILSSPHSQDAVNHVQDTQNKPCGKQTRALEILGGEEQSTGVVI